MNCANSTFISSTFWSERSGPTAALATIKELKKINPSIDRNIFTSMNNVNLNCILGTKTNGVYKSFLEDYDKEIEHEKE